MLKINTKRVWVHHHHLCSAVENERREVHRQNGKNKILKGRLSGTKNASFSSSKEKKVKICRHHNSRKTRHLAAHSQTLIN